MSDDNIFNPVDISRSATKLQIIDYIKKNLELESVDLTKSSFLSFLVDVVSSLTSNLLFYQLSTYKEFFLTKASLPESILNLSAFLGYKASLATPAKTDLLIKIPLKFGSGTWKIDINKTSTFMTGSGTSITFLPDYNVKIEITNDTDVNVVFYKDLSPSTVPIVLANDKSYFAFSLPVTQYKFSTYEYVIEDIRPFQFVFVDVPVSDQIYDLDVLVQPPGSLDQIHYTKFDSLYLMSNKDYGYVVKRTGNGVRLYFGNNIIGIQPEASSKVIVNLEHTAGSSGNVIAGSINKGDRFYVYTDNGTKKQLNYSVTNLAPACGGKDAESVEEIRRNSITNIRTLNRLVSQQDYSDIGIVSRDLPTIHDVYPVLKKSDLSGNIINEYIVAKFKGEIVPTRTVKLAASYHNPFIKRKCLINVDGVPYITLFDMYLDPDNESASYVYTMDDLIKVPVLLTTYECSCQVEIDSVHFKRLDNSLEIRAHYLTNNNSDFQNLQCVLTISEMGYSTTMTNDIFDQEFVTTITPLSIIPNGSLTVYFLITHPVYGSVRKYSIDVITRKKLDTYMTSDTFSDSTSNITLIYDVPVISQDWYEQIDKNEFELDVVNQLISFENLNNKRMLTDFSNLKFCNSYGMCYNAQYNEPTLPDVIDIGVPTDSTSDIQIGDRYIVTGEEGFDWVSHKNEIAECSNIDPLTWVFLTSHFDDVVYVLNKYNKYVFSQDAWLEMKYELPLKISLEVFASESYTGTSTQLADLVKETLVDSYKDRFRVMSNLHISGIIDVVQNLNEVKYLKVVEPKTDIFFDYKIDNFTEDQLLNYVPDYIYFTKDSISVKIFLHRFDI